jgi:hypothetical protein
MKNRVTARFLAPVIVVAAAIVPLTSAAADSTPVLKRVSQDRLVDSIGYHQTEVQPALASGGLKTLVSTFEVGRAYNGGASAIGWATSQNGGGAWDHGLLPATVIAGGPSGTWRGADPSVAYDARYAKWIAAYTGLGSTATTLGLFVDTSSDGLSWSAPITVHAAASGDTPGKSWVTCDNKPASSGYGNCYIAYTNTASTPANQLFLVRSTDGGGAWSAPVGTPDVSVGTGAIPLVQPPAPSSPNTCGRVVVSYANGATLDDFTSSDCGATASAHSVITSTQAAQHTPAQGLRVSLLPSASLDGAGAIYLGYQTRSFRIAQTTLSAASNAGDTNIKVGSVTGMVVGNTLTVDPTGSNPETVTITTVGTAGAGGTGVTFTPALAFAHSQGAFVTVNGIPSTSTAAPNDIALAVMPGPTDATPAPSFGTPSRIPIEADTGASSNTVDHFIPAIAADPNTSGGSTHLALFYYWYPNGGCGNFIQDLILPVGGPQPANQCQPRFGYTNSTNAGGSWAAPQTLASMPSLAVVPRTGPIGTTGNGNPDLGLYTSGLIIPTGPLAGKATSVFDYGATVDGFDESMYVPYQGLVVGGGS